MWNSGSNWTQKKDRVFMQMTNARKNMRTAYFTRKLSIPISHNGEMFEFLKFQGKDSCSSWRGDFLKSFVHDFRLFI